MDVEQRSGSSLERPPSSASSSRASTPGAPLLHFPLAGLLEAGLVPPLDGLGAAAFRCGACLAGFPSPWLLEQHAALQHLPGAAGKPHPLTISDVSLLKFRAFRSGQTVRLRSMRPVVPVPVRLRETSRAEPSSSFARRQTVFVRRLRHAIPLPQVIQEAPPQPRPRASARRQADVRRRGHAHLRPAHRRPGQRSGIEQQ